MKIQEIQTKSVITKSNLPDADYVINPYTGCSHQCLYCYARFMKRFTNHQEPWGQFVDIKINAPDTIPDKTDKYHNKSIFLSSVCDPYQPLEKKHKLTRKMLEKLIPLQPDLSIQTKSDLVTRDVDLLKKFKHREVGLTITTLDDDIRREIEPNTSSVNNRIKTLETLNKAGINTYVFIGPILPFITNWQAIVKTVKSFVNCFMFENLTVRGSIWPSVKKWLKIKHPELLQSYEKIYFTKNDYWNKVEQQIKNYGNDNSLDFRIYFHHKKSNRTIRANSPTINN